MTIRVTTSLLLSNHEDYIGATAISRAINGLWR
jgi:hypothetical protein